MNHGSSPAETGHPGDATLGAMLCEMERQLEAAVEGGDMPRARRLVVVMRELRELGAGAAGAGGGASGGA